VSHIVVSIYPRGIVLHHTPNENTYIVDIDNEIRNIMWIFFVPFCFNIMCQIYFNATLLVSLIICLYSWHWSFYHVLQNNQTQGMNVTPTYVLDGIKWMNWKFSQIYVCKRTTKGHCKWIVKYNHKLREFLCVSL
jgi:hypothetical protein